MRDWDEDCLLVASPEIVALGDAPQFAPQLVLDVAPDEWDRLLRHPSRAWRADKPALNRVSALLTPQNTSAGSGKYKHCVLFPTMTASWKRAMPSESINAFAGVHNMNTLDSHQSDAPTRRIFRFTVAAAPRRPLATHQANQTSQATPGVIEDVIMSQIAHPPQLQPFRDFFHQLISLQNHIRTSMIRSNLAPF